MATPGWINMPRLWKLMPIAAVVTAVALLLLGGLMAYYAELSYREQKANEVNVQAQILASAVTAALVFNDPAAAEEDASALAANPEVRSAAVYDAAGNLFASFSARGSLPIPDSLPSIESVSAEDRVVAIVPVVQGGEMIGSVYLRTIVEPLASRALRYGAIVLLVTMASLVVAVLGMAQAALSRANREVADRAAALGEVNAALRAEIEQRELAEEALRQSQKMEAMGQLTGGIAHDFNNLMQVITANLGLIGSDLKGNEKATKRLRSALAGANRASGLTRQLLAFARRQPLEPKVISLGRLLGDTSDLLRRTLGETITVECVISGGLWNTLTDPIQLENAILNLALNSRDAMPGGGKLTLEVANASLDDAYAAQHRDVEPGQYVMVTVTDTGAGMSPEQVARAFDPFFTTKAEGQGTGLGLSQVYGFVKQSGGHVKIYSEPGHGTSVRLYLPRSRHAEEPVLPPMAGRAVGKGEWVLVVEDDSAVRDAATEMLKELGYRVLEAEDGKSGLSVLSSGVTIDLLFTDVVMPGPVGSRELARRAVELQPGIAVLFTSGYSENAIIHHGRLDEGVFLLSKPYAKDELARKVRTVLAARRQEPAPSGGEAAPAPEPKPVPSARLRVLLVEDEVLVRMATADMIEELGHEVIEASDARTALKLAAGADVIDVLFTDIKLPDMLGTVLAAEMRRQDPGLKIIFATGYSDPPADAADSGAIFLAKPFQPADVARALRQLAAK